MNNTDNQINVGDKVTIIKNTLCMEIGQIVTVVEVDKYDKVTPYKVETEHGWFYWIRSEVIIPVVTDETIGEILNNASVYLYNKRKDGWTKQDVISELKLFLDKG